MFEIDHDLKQVYSEEMQIQEEAAEVLLANQDAISQRLTTPIVTTYVDTEKISFERYIKVTITTLTRKKTWPLKILLKFVVKELS